MYHPSLSISKQKEKRKEKNADLPYLLFGGMSQEPDIFFLSFFFLFTDAE